MDAAMELTPLVTSDTEIEVMVHGENETFLVPLLHRLLEDPKVDYATYLLGHILMDEPKLYVRVTEGSPQEALERAADTVRDDLDALNEQFLAQVAESAA